MIRQWIVWYAIVLHFWWAVLCMISEAPLATVPLAGMRGINHYIAAGLFALSATLALTSVLHEDTLGVMGFVLLLPQQAVLTMAAFAAVGLIVSGHYLDGVVRARVFIAADQAPFVLGAVFHSGAILERYGWSLATMHRMIWRSHARRP